MAVFKKNKKGRILRIKEGYNPNSSSVGSQIPYLFSFFVGTGTTTLIILHLLYKFKKFKKVIKIEKKVNEQ